MKLAKLKNLAEANQESTARKIAKQILTATREKFPSDDAKALKAAQEAAKTLAIEVQKEIVKYNKESTFVQ